MIKKKASHELSKAPSYKKIFKIVSELSKLSFPVSQSFTVAPLPQPTLVKPSPELIQLRSRSRAKLERLSAELYLKKVKDRVSCPTPVGLPQHMARVIRPVRDFTGQVHAPDSSDQALTGVYSTPLLRTRAKDATISFGYVVGQKKEMTGKTHNAVRRRAINIRLPKETHYNAQAANRTMSHGRTEVEAALSHQRSESLDRTTLDDIFDYVHTTPLKVVPLRKVIYQSSVMKGYGNYSFF